MTNDPDLQTLSKVIAVSWPSDKHEVPEAAVHYFHFRDEASEQDGIISRVIQAVIPSNLGRAMLEWIHLAHIGIEGCLRRARECLYWPSMSSAIKDYMDKCSICHSFDSKQANAKKRCILIKCQVDRGQKGTDLFSWNDLNYLITKDYYSGFLEVDALPGTASRTVTNKLKADFACYDIPDVCISDNGPQFSSEEFKVFSHKMAIWAQDIFTRVSPKQREGRASCQNSQDFNEEGKESLNRSIPFTLVAQKHSYPRARVKSCPTSNEQKDKNPTSKYCEPPYTNALR